MMHVAATIWWSLLLLWNVLAMVMTAYNDDFVLFVASTASALLCVTVLLWSEPWEG